jgi:type IX secretion system PorP/SprF family membrane protein
MARIKKSKNDEVYKADNYIRFDWAIKWLQGRNVCLSVVNDLLSFYLMKIVSKILFVLLLFLGTHIRVLSQELPVHEQYIFDYSLVNASFVGLTEATIVKLSHRQQWFGTQHPPNTSVALARHRFKATNFGLGGYFFQDQNGANSNYGMQVSGSYHLLLKSKRTTKHVLSFGLSLKGAIHILDESGFERDTYDPIIRYSTSKTYLCNANAGILYSTTSFFAGYSIENLIPLIDNMYKQQFEPRFKFIHNVHFGKLWDFRDNQQIRASLIYKSNFTLQHQIDASFRYYYLFGQAARSKHVKYRDEIWGGINYKQTLDVNNFSPLSIQPIIGCSLKNYSIALLYDYPLSALSSYCYGSVQILLAVRFNHTDWKFWQDFSVPNFYFDF